MLSRIADYLHVQGLIYSHFALYLFHSYSPHVLIYHLITLAMNIERAIRVHSFTTLTEFWQLLTIYLPRPCRALVDISESFHLLVYGKSTYCWRFHYQKPTSSYQRSWKTTSLARCSMYCGAVQRYTYRVLQTIQMKSMLLCFWAEQAVMGSAKAALKFKYEI